MNSKNIIRIEKPLLLLVEGRDDYWFFGRIIEKRLGIGDFRRSDVQIIEFAEESKLGVLLENTIVPAIRTSSLDVQAIGVVRDADDSYPSAFQSVQGSLQNAGLPVPNAPLESANGALPGGGNITVVTYVMPNNACEGNLETLCLSAISHAQAMICVDSYIDCLKSNGLIPKYERKARLHAFLAANPDDPTLLPGQAILANVIPWNSPAFDAVHRFLDMLDAVN